MWGVSGLKSRDSGMTVKSVAAGERSQLFSIITLVNSDLFNKSKISEQLWDVITLYSLFYGVLSKCHNCSLTYWVKSSDKCK